MLKKKKITLHSGRSNRRHVSVIISPFMGSHDAQEGVNEPLMGIVFMVTNSAAEKSCNTLYFFTFCFQGARFL